MDTNSTLPAQLDLKAFALALLQPLCDEPGAATVTLSQTGSEAACHATVAESDYVRLSNSRGRTVRSLGTVLGAAASKLGSRCSLDLQPGH